MICSAFNLLYRPHSQENVLFQGLETYVHSRTRTTFPVSMCIVVFNGHLVSHVKIPYLGIQDPFLNSRLGIPLSCPRVSLFTGFFTGWEGSDK